MWGGATEMEKVINGFVTVPTSEDCVSAVLVLLLSGIMKYKIEDEVQRQNVLTKLIEKSVNRPKMCKGGYTRSNVLTPQVCLLLQTENRSSNM
jgi:hypothetical protein